jgi:tetratricopeptide (TPR) repeat protein
MKRLLLLNWIKRHKIATVCSATVAAIVFFAWLFRGDRGTPVRLAAAVAAHRAAETCLENAQLADADRQCRRAIEILDELAPWSFDSRVRFERAGAFETMALIQSAAYQLDEANASFRKAIAAWAVLVGEGETAVTARLRMVRCLSRHATLLSETGRWEEVEKTLGLAENVCRAPNSKAVADERIERELVLIENQRGSLFLHSGRLVLALESFELAALIQNALIRTTSASGPNLELLVSALMNQAIAQSARLQPEAALQKFAEARGLAERLNSEHPGTGRYQDLMATILEREAAETGRDSDKAEQARELLGRALTIRESLVAGSPAEPEYLEKLAATCGALAESYRAGRSLAKAEEFDRKELLFQSKLQQEHPRVIAFRFGRGRALHNLADALRQRGRSAEALELAREAAPLLASVHRENVLDQEHRRAASFAYWNLCTLELDRKDLQAAAQAINQYQTIEPRGYEEPHESAGFLCRCIILCRDDPKLPAAEKESLARSCADRAIGALETAVQSGFRNLNELKTSHVYDPLRGRADFGDVLQKVEAFNEAMRGG